MFKADAAATALNACSTLIGHLLALRQSTKDVKDLGAFAGPDGDFHSGVRLAEQYSSLADDLDAALGAHIGIVQSMASTFKEAAKTFAAVDGESAASFAKIAMTTVPGGFSNPLPDPAKAWDSVATPKPYLTDLQLPLESEISKVYAAPADYRAVQPENPYNKHWNELYKFGQSIKPDPVVLAARHWTWMSGEVFAYFEEFRSTAVDKGIQDGWVGKSAGGAIGAVNKVVSDGKALSTVAGQVGGDLLEAAAWLKTTKPLMPQTENEPSSSSTLQLPGLPASVQAKGLLGYQYDCDSYYIAGIIKYNTHLRAIESPTDGTPSTPGTTPGNTPGTTPGTTPGGTPSTPGSPSTPTVPTDTDPKNTDPANPTKTDTPTTTTDTTLQTLITQASTVLQAGITAAEQGVEKLATAVQTALTQTKTTEKTTDPTDQLTQQLQNLGLIPKTDSPGVTPTGGSPTGGTPTGAPQTPKTQPSPKAATPTSATETEVEAETATASRAGLASTSSSSSSGTSSGMGGSPMGAAGSQGQSKEHKRPQFLTNLENLEEVLGESPAAVTPVAER
ncbi:hypothetical protein [Nocardia sp. NPDC004722]